MTKRKRTIAIDFDHTLWDPAGKCLLAGAKASLATLRDYGCYIIVHSCNNPQYIKQCLAEAGIWADAIWGENPADCGSKPDADAYVDDKGIRFTTWADTMAQLEGLVKPGGQG